MVRQTGSVTGAKLSSLVVSSQALSFRPKRGVKQVMCGWEKIGCYVQGTVAVAVDVMISVTTVKLCFHGYSLAHTHKLTHTVSLLFIRIIYTCTCIVITKLSRIVNILTSR